MPSSQKYQGVADFVMARKEVGYVPGTRTPIVEPGNLYDDLSRRDFTINAMAKDPDTGEIISLLILICGLSQLMRNNGNKTVNNL